MIENLYPDKRWLIIPTSITSSIDWNQVQEASIDTLRLSVDGTKTFVKYEFTDITASYTQSYIDAKTGELTSSIIEAGIYGRPDIYPQGLGEYTHSEILEILSTPEWDNPIPTGSISIEESVVTSSYITPNPLAPLPTTFNP